MKTQLLSPWRVDEQRYLVNVSVIEVELKQPWSIYANYNYLGGVDTKLQRIPRHCWGLKGPNESLYRAPRLIYFVDITGCNPASSSQNSNRAFHKVKTIAHCDHTTYWYGPNKEPYVLTEPYWPHRAELEEEIRERDLCAVILPDPGIYAGGNGRTSSVLMGLPEHRTKLLDIAATLSLTGWPPMPEIREINWFEATKLKRIQEVGACHV